MYPGYTVMTPRMAAAINRGFIRRAAYRRWRRIHKKNALLTALH